MGVAAHLVKYRRQIPDRKQFGEFVRECREQKKFELGQIKLGELAKECFGEAFGPRLAQFSNRQEWVREGTDALDATAFRDVIGTMSTASMEEGYARKADNILALVGTYETPDQPEGEKTIHFKQSATGTVGAVAPGMEYPRAGQGGYRIAAPEPTKFGLVGVLTIEAVKANETRQFLQEQMDIGGAVGAHQVREFLRVITGIRNTYKRNGTTINTYLTSGAWINAVEDFDITKGPAEFDRLDQLFDRMVHPITGEPIEVMPTAMLTVGAQHFQIRSIMKSTEIRVTNGTTTSVGANPLLNTEMQLEKNSVLRQLLISELGYNAAQADSTFFYGDLQGAFKYRQIEPFQVFETGDQTDVGFFQDIVYAAKGRWWGVPFVYDPMKVIRARKAS
jgi:hypothetical protein